APDRLLPLADLRGAPRRPGRRRDRAAALPGRGAARREAVPRRLRVLQRSRGREVGEQEAPARAAGRPGAGQREPGERTPGRGAEEADAVRGGGDLPAGLSLGEHDRPLVSDECVRAAGDDRRRLELRHSHQHADRHRRRSDRTRDEREPAHRTRHVAHRSRQQRAGARRHARRRRSHSPRTGQLALLRPGGEGADREEGRHRRHAGNGRPPLSRSLSVRHPDRPRAQRRHQRHRLVPHRASDAVCAVRLAGCGGRADLHEEAVSGFDGVKAAILLFLAAIVQVSIFSQVHMLGGVPDVLLVMLVAVSLLRGSILGAGGGFFAGLLVDTATLGQLGLTSLVLTIAGYWIGSYGETTGRDRAHAPFLSVAVVTVLYSFGLLLVHFVLGERAPAGSVTRGLLPAIVLILILTAPVYALVRRLLRPLDRCDYATEVQLLGYHHDRAASAERPDDVRDGRL